ncbi:hypothetical protein C6380_12820 [Pseudomonas syringae pv. actinidiae]|uniref:hypothetical protein n=1 Tax=Pseudomonas syringae TaxID=317 RepID=UPI000BB55819|nr:hypothetical protein [Pseudomonas syringae]PBK49096.1 hypothetical protein BUE61_24000 [Pseudomonas syringae pv. actinidiae]PBK49135.1 hypothetical protein BUE60_25105 [Pseudomonas syringae pv. actinidiae]RJX55230.1 hypothetical protein C6383_24770 [Pseudomonas syringae pv. actinidiae]RJX56383.1 hypothetical protein C6380_12820 [Pseudomonas syringae pv. actinidiae]RJX60633.1 hypothetical protein C6379_05855 [Pseudomonas syringae pv. actinidiae]
MDTSMAFQKYFELKDATEGGIFLRREHAEVEVIRGSLWKVIALLNERGDPDVYPYFFVENGDELQLLSETRLSEVIELANRLGRAEQIKPSPFQESTYYFKASQKFLGFHIAKQLNLTIAKAGQYRLVADNFAIDCSPWTTHRFFADGSRFLR